ncbi:MAG: NAD(P)/FAD-dependent oxidoreductase, partial [Aquihabitans sp.]
PIVEGGLVAGAVVKDKDTGSTRAIRAKYVVIADGANSRFGRALGTARNRSYPQGMAIRTYYESPLHDEPWIES